MSGADRLSPGDQTCWLDLALSLLISAFLLLPAHSHTECPACIPDGPSFPPPILNRHLTVVLCRCDLKSQSFRGLEAPSQPRAHQADLD